MSHSELVEERKGERKLQLNKERAALSGAFTRTENKLYEILKDEHSQQHQLDDLLSSLEKTLQKLEKQVDKVIELEDDENEKSKLHAVVGDAEARLSQAQSAVSQWKENKNTFDQTEVKRKQEMAFNEEQYQLKLRMLDLQREQLELECRLSRMKVDDNTTSGGLDTKTSQEGEPSRPTMPSYSDHETGHTSSYPDPEKEEFAELLRIMQLPKTELKPFDGNPLEFWTFIRSFDYLVDSTRVSASAKFQRLLQYCTGPAYDAIQCYAAMEPSQGYQEARAKLFSRFGDQASIAQGMILKVTEGPQVKASDTNGLRKYADLVNSCVVILSSMNKLNDIDNQGKMQLILGRLPHYLQTRWAREAIKHRSRHGAYPNISHLSEFVQSAASEADDPVFGLAQYQSQPQAKDRGTRAAPQFSQGRKAQSFGMQVQVSRACLKCGGNHLLFRCDAFGAMQLKDKFDFLVSKKLCFNCFSPQHISQQCPRPSNCNKCKRKHSNHLHDDKKTQDQREKELDASVQVSSSAFASSKCVALPIVPVFVRSSSGDDMKVYALLDPGSTNTFCSRHLASKLGLKGRKTSLLISTITSSSEKSVRELIDLQVESMDLSYQLSFENVIVVPRLPDLQANMVSSEDINGWEHLRDISLPQIHRHSEISLLIGQDNPMALTPLEVRFSGRRDPYASKTIFGWTINGPLEKKVNKIVSSNFVALEEQVQRFWEMDHEVQESLAMSPRDKKVVTMWEEHTEREGSHYKLPIPFKEDHPPLADNMKVAKNRLSSLTKKLKEKAEVYQSYDGGIKDMIEKGYAEVVPEKEISAPDKITWYVPHHAVTSASKPGKVRIVFDCSARYGVSSLNDVVHQGPDLTNSLIGVLLKFREGPIAISADIESMYHRVKIADKHRDALRFLWWKDGTADSEVQIYRMTSHPFGGIWSSSCANYALRRVADDYSDDFSSAVCQAVHDNFYVDDYLDSLITAEEAINRRRDLCDLLQRGSFRLTKWVSNNRDVLQSIPVEERASDFKNLDLCSNELPQGKALGVQWNVETDELRFKVKPKEKSITRRGMLSAITSLFDPLGLLSPVILRAKLIFQDECRRRKAWDDPLEPENELKWFQWLTRLPCVERVAVPRCVLPLKMESVELHHFADASAQGYGAVSYLRAVDTEGSIHCAFLLGKARLAPIKAITIPRLELCAAVLAVKLDQAIRREVRFEVKRSLFWTDSQITLHYVKNEEHRYQTFVANRVSQIQNASSPEDWRHIKGEFNPADDASRGLDPEELTSNHRWFHGPEFLWFHENEWPQSQIQSPLPEVLEIRKPKVFASSVSDPDSCTDRLMRRYSSFVKLKKMVSWILRLKSTLMARVRNKSSKATMDMSSIQAAETQSAEIEIIKFIQYQEFQAEVQQLCGGHQVKRTSPILSLEPFLNKEGVLCVGGRLKRAAVPEEAKHQFILHKKSFVSRLIILHYHESLAHVGAEHVLSEMRQRYWIVGARSLIKEMIRKCVICKRIKGAPMSQRMADLPGERLDYSQPPFTHVGVDCFGPFFVKRGRSDIKRFGCIFTCMTSRAIHLEKLDTMETESFLNALKRFVSRRGQPTSIFSDNGSNFKGADKELKAALSDWNQKQINGYMLQRGITWKFNPPLASHMGGTWERLIRSVRKVLTAMLHEQKGKLSDESLETLFCEVERVINSRPITVNPSSPSEASALTPNHLLLMREDSCLPSGLFRERDYYSKRWKFVQHLADQFWSRWRKEYLPTIQFRQKWREVKVNVHIGDIVLLMDDNAPRNMWLLGRVLEIYPGDDGLVRSVKVKTMNSTYVRPVSKLCMLESVGGN